MKISQNEINIGKDNIDNLIKQVNYSEIASSQVSSKRKHSIEVYFEICNQL